MAVDTKALLTALQGDVVDLTADLHRRVEADASVKAPLVAEYDGVHGAGRTGQSFSEWLEDRLTQVAVAWVLACVFVRFAEDNQLIPDARLAGEGQRGVEARAAQQDFFAANPLLADRDYLHDVFRRAAALPGLGDLLAETPDNLVWSMDPSSDACTALIERFRAKGDDGVLRFDFADEELSTRFLGDLYQDLSAYAKSKYALLQTPEFVEEFILDRTMTPALDVFGLADTDVIDPTCGSGHFLLGAFGRLTKAWVEAEPALDRRQVAQRALAAIGGVDLNPYAVAIARFRLLVAALRFCGIRSLADAPDFHVNLAVGDSLLWGTGKAIEQGLPGVDDEAEQQRALLYRSENAEDLTRVLGRRYAVVVGNPPYITVKDKAANDAYRRLYKSTHRQYSLSVPFMERFFGLARRPDGSGRPAGYVGQITSNSFMKREFGKKLIEDFIPTWDVTEVIDTSGAYVPGHGTPTVIVIGRNQRPIAETIRTVMGIRGEPSQPPDPAKGSVWCAIVDQVDDPGSESDFVSVADTDRSRFANHPWSIGGGGAAELKEAMQLRGPALRNAISPPVGRAVRIGSDDPFELSRSTRRRLGLDTRDTRAYLVGEEVRDWLSDAEGEVWYPYSDGWTGRFLKERWPWKTTLARRRTFQGEMADAGLCWWDFMQHTSSAYSTPLSIAFSNVATHNHFSLNRGGTVFSAHAPVIKLPAGATIDDHLRLLGLLNSSVACFWMQQVFHNKGAGGGARVAAGYAAMGDEAFLNHYEFDGTKLQELPIPSAGSPIDLARRLDELVTARVQLQPGALADRERPTRAGLDAARVQSEALGAEMVAAQEELDWWCLHLYELTAERLCVPDGEVPPPLQLGERAFEIVLARKVAAGEAETAWFTRHRSTPITELPAHWPDWYRELVERRIELIETDRDVALVERPENKRRWQSEPWETAETVALAGWLLDRLEDRGLWFESGRAVVRSLRQLADRMSADADWMVVARLWAGVDDVDALAVIERLVADQHVPAQAAARYTASGLVKRAEWEQTWELQRAEDRGEDVGTIAVPPKYAQKDFAKSSYWSQRGKLDVPKERFVSVPGAERDGSLVLAWAGFDHAELAQALATLLHQRQVTDGWSDAQLVPVLVALAEVLPWVAQWRPEIDPNIGQPLAEFYGGMVDQALAGAGATRATLAEWRPPAPTRGRRARKAAVPAEPTLEDVAP